MRLAPMLASDAQDCVGGCYDWVAEFGSCGLNNPRFFSCAHDIGGAGAGEAEGI